MWDPREKGVDGRVKPGHDDTGMWGTGFGISKAHAPES
jgi:hypothetical protein